MFVTACFDILWRVKSSYGSVGEERFEREVESIGLLLKKLEGELFGEKFVIVLGDMTILY